MSLYKEAWAILYKLAEENRLTQLMWLMEQALNKAKDNRDKYLKGVKSGK